MSEAEYQARRDKGLCFRCEEKFFKGHRCKIKEVRALRVLLAGDSDEDEEEFDLALEIEPVQEVAELAIRSVVGFSDPGTMKIHGRMGEKIVVVLIDCGATHNFISEKLADELQLPRSETSNYGIIMGNGSTLKGKGVCKGVTMMVQDLTI